MASLSGRPSSAFRSFIVLGKNEYSKDFAGVDGKAPIECSAIEMSSAMLNWLMISD